MSSITWNGQDAIVIDKLESVSMRLNIVGNVATNVLIVGNSNNVRHIIHDINYYANNGVNIAYLRDLQWEGVETINKFDYIFFVSPTTKKEVRNQKQWCCNLFRQNISTEEYRKKFYKNYWSLLTKHGLAEVSSYDIFIDVLENLSVDETLVLVRHGPEIMKLCWHKCRCV